MNTAFIAFFRVIFSITLLFPALSSPERQATESVEYEPLAVEDIIYLVNSIRTSSGLKPLEVSNILMSVAQSTAETMAADHMMGHIGDVRGRVMAAGYGGGEAAWATENFAIFPVSQPQTGLLDAWSDAEHMIPMSNGTYRHIGVGIARDGDVYYYILQAAYTSSNAWQPYYSSTPGEGTEVSEVTDSGLSEWMSPVITSTPHADGSIIHVVQPGQTLWSIAIAYGTKILDILAYNNLPSDYQTIYTGQILAIPVTAVPAPTQTPEATITSISTVPISTPRFAQSLPSPSSSITLTTLPSTPEVREIKIRNILFFLLGTGVIFLLAGFLMKNPKK